MNVQHYKTKEKKYTFFGTALFLRPSKEDQRHEAKNFHVKDVAQYARQNPGDWECLLMKRNYLDFAWDSIGGHNDINEFPAQTMAREVLEEVGWKTKEYMEICRQWRNGFLNGFVYLVVPEESRFMEDSPPRIPCDEVQTVAYFNLLHILKSDQFKPNVKGRILAFIQNESDFKLL